MPGKTNTVETITGSWKVSTIMGGITGLWVWVIISTVDYFWESGNILPWQFILGLSAGLSLGYMLVTPRQISWNEQEITIKRIWGLEYTYKWKNLRGKDSPLFYLGSYGFSMRDWREFQKWMRDRFPQLVSSVPWLEG